MPSFIGAEQPSRRAIRLGEIEGGKARGQRGQAVLSLDWLFAGGAVDERECFNACRHYSYLD